MKNFRDILKEGKTVKKFEPTRTNGVRDILTKLTKELPVGKYPIEFDGYKPNEADFTFKATLKIIDITDGEKGFVIKKGKRQGFRADVSMIRPSSGRGSNRVSIKDIYEVRVKV